MEIKQLRNEINKINQEILDLFNRRMDLSAQVAQYKKEHGMPIFDPKREEEIIETVRKNARKEFQCETVEIFKALMNSSKNYQHKILTSAKFHPEFLSSLEADVVAYQGVEGAYSFQAAKECFPQANLQYVKTFEQVFEAVDAGHVSYGVLPIENSSTGTLFEVYELLQKYHHYIIAEKVIKVDHNLMSVKGATIDGIREIYSHPQAFMQCEKFLSQLPNTQQISYYNTAISAKNISQWNDPTKAAIASKSAAKLYDLTILSENINDNSNNYTRFIVISKKFQIVKGADRVSSVFTIKNQAGHLYHILGIFANNNLNLIKLESRPYENRPWQYLFFADFEGNLYENQIDSTISYLKNETENFQILGNYSVI